MPLFVQPLAPEVFTVADFCSPDECAALIARGEALGFEKATIHLRGGQQMLLPGARNNDRAIWDDVAFAASMWARIAPLIGEGPDGQRPIGLNERWRFYRYEPEQRFKVHRDGVVDLPQRVVDGHALPAARSHTTLMVYLNDACVGGETAFYTESRAESLRVRPEAGTALCFAHRLLHEGCRVVEGVKYVLRSDILYAV